MEDYRVLQPNGACYQVLKIIRRIMLYIIILLIAPAFIAWIIIAQPTVRRNEPSAVAAEPAGLAAHVKTLSEAFYPRNFRETENLEKCAAYIRTHFEAAGAAVRVQSWTVGRDVYKNVIGRFGDPENGVFVVGAHYDAFSDTPGADDNASGVAGLIELAGLLGREQTDVCVELAAYCLEEPPFFGTDQMGSAVHAKALHESKVRVLGMLSFEMIGCFSDAPGSQQYPMALLRLFYPGRGNFIVVAGRLDQRAFVRRIKAGMKGAADLPVFSVNAPPIIAGIDLSDHMNYWRYGMDAAMITDTAFYRNPRYHGKEDRWDALDYGRMAKVVVAVFEMLRTF